MTRWTLDHGQLARDGEPMLTLVRAQWGDDAPSAATLNDLERRIVDLLNAADADTGCPDCRARTGDWHDGHCRYDGRVGLRAPLANVR